MPLGPVRGDVLTVRQESSAEHCPAALLH